MIERLLGRTALMLIALSVGFCALDQASRVLLDTRTPIEQQFPVEDYRHPKPYVMFGGRGAEAGGGAAAPEIRGLELGGDGETLNRLGYRGPAPSAAKRPGVKRIFLLGGSTVIAGDPPIAVLLEELLGGTPPADANAEGVEVFNFGVLSSVSGMDLARVVYEASSYAPDLVLFYNGGNDLLHPYTWDPRPGYPFNFIAFEHNPVLERDQARYPALALFAFGSHLLRSLFPGHFLERFVPVATQRERVGWGGEAWRDAIAARYVEHLVKADAVARGFGARFAAFFQPLVHFKPALADEERELVDPEKREIMRDLRRRVQRELVAATAADPLTLVDLSGLYDDTDAWVFTDEIHTRQSAKARVARAIADGLRDGGLLAEPSVP